MDLVAKDRNKWINRNKYYYEKLTEFLKFSIPENSSIIEIGCGTGYILRSLNPSRAVGIDSSPEMIRIASENNPGFSFFEMNAEEISLNEKFDFVIISDTIGYFEDVQKVFLQIQKLCDENTRVIITYINFLWLPMLNIAEKLRLKMPQLRNNWLNILDITNLLQLSNFEVVKSGRKILFPLYIPFVSEFLNRYISNLPLFNSLCLTENITARKIRLEKTSVSVSVVVPARNEKGNIEQIVSRIPEMGSHTQVIFVEGNSNDNTYEEIQRVCGEYKGNLELLNFRQNGTGKADAVRKGFENSTGDILMILDADISVPPEDLIKFYNAISEDKGEFLNGSRLVYPLEKDAMRTLNILGNKFFSVMFSWILNQRIKDTLCGTKVISRNNYEKLKSLKNFLGDFDPFGDFDLIFGAAKLNLKFVEIPVRYKARVYGETNISRFRHGFMLLKMTLYAMNKFKFI